MSSQKSLRQLSLTDLKKNCEQETAQFLSTWVDDTWHCYELFRRAIVEKDNDAWDAVLSQYHHVVERWVERHPKFNHFTENTDFFVNRAFTKFWQRNLSPQEFSKFPNVKSLLGYIKTCVASVMTDYWRIQSRLEIEYKDELTKSPDEHNGTDPADEFENQLQRRRFWEHLRRHLRDEMEYQIVFETFVVGLKPLEILDHFPELYPDVKEVYKIKARALNRLGKYVDLLDYFSENPKESD